MSTVMNSILEHQAMVSRLLVMESEIEAAGMLLARTLKNGGRIYACGNGGSAADAQHFVAELVGRFERERGGLPAVALTADAAVMTAIGNDYGFEYVFARQVRAMGRVGDVLVAITTSGNSENVVQAIWAAEAVGMRCVVLTGGDGGKIGEGTGVGAVVLKAPSKCTARIQEAHGLIIHCLCEVIDRELGES